MKMRMLAALSAAMIMGWSAANAALVDAPLDCAAGGVSLDAGNYETCEGAFLGNDSQLNFENEINGLFGTTGIWSEYGKAEEENGWDDGLVAILTGQGASTGTFSVSGLPSSAVFVVKSSGCFSAYYFTGVADPATGGFDTAAAGLQTSNTCDGNLGPGISHLTVYTGGDDTPVIPLPASALLLLGGIGGLGALRKVRKS
jgi:hypothetical protein